jgi:aminoglycoside phosphotransferase (APT) family kinase protein
VSVGSAPDRRALVGRELEAALLALVERHSGQGALRYARPPTALAGGHWAAIYGFCVAGAPPGFAGELVLRLMPDDERGRRESVLQQAVAALGFPAPRIRLAGGPEAGLGARFAIMDRAPGGSIADGLSTGERARAVRRMPRLLGETMATLHALDPAPVLAALEQAGWSRVAQGVGGLMQEIGEAIERLALARYDRVLAWLHARRVEPEWLVICHGDLHGFNVILNEGELSGVVDWTNARVAEPAFDVAYTATLLEQMPIAVPPLLRPLLGLVGRRASRQFLESYRLRGSFNADRLRWYEALHALRLLVRVAEARRSETPLPPSHPWELAVAASQARLEQQSEIRLELPPAS